MMRITKIAGSRVRGCVTWPARVTISLAFIGVYVGGMLTPGVVRAVQSQCPNEAVRVQQDSGGLPECRGYELASRFPKQGNKIELTDSESASRISGYLTTVAENGEQISVGSNAAGLGVLGQEDSPTGSDTFLRRNEESGWSAEPLNPPQSQFSDQVLLGSDANTGTSLWLLHTPDMGLYEGSLYVRSSTGQFKLVGLEAPSGAPEAASLTMDEEFGRANDTDGVVGASKEFTHVVLKANSNSGGRYLWPGDTTVTQAAYGGGGAGLLTGSLYEYAGEATPGDPDRPPVLVGVEENEPGHTELIGECGTSLGTLRGDISESNPHVVQHEVSEEGDVVFFSPVPIDVINCGGKQPAVQELYARIDERETVDISEPVPNKACSENPECAVNAAIPADAELEAASTNGSRVFFTSTQQLLPGATEDPESRDSARVGCFETEEAGGCNLYEYDLHPGEPSANVLKLVSAGRPSGAEVQGVIAASNDGSHVYFVAKGNLTGTEQNGAGKEAVQGKDNLYVYEPNPKKPDESFVMFIATLSPKDAGPLWEAEESEAKVTPDGDFLVFRSREKLTTGDTSEASQLFEYDALTETLVRVSISEKVEGQSYGKNGNVASALESPGLSPESVMSNDGKTVVFGSKAALSPHASAAFSSECTSVYEYSWAGSQSITEGEVHLISDGKDMVQGNNKICGTQAPAVDGSGEDIWFSTSDPLTWEDGDAVLDIYDARIDGGTLPPEQEAGCTGSACQQSPTPPLAGGGLGSELARDGENVTSPTPSPGVAKPKTKPKALTRAQKLAKALKACRSNTSRKRHHHRSSCEKQAKKLYGRGK
jgi:hypothetical protein